MTQPPRRAPTALVAALSLLLGVGIAPAILAPAQAAPPSEPALQRVTLVDLPVSTGANILTSSLTLSASHPATAFRLTYLVKSGATDATLQPVVITEGGVSAVGDLNGTTVPTAGDWHTWSLGASKTSSNGDQALSYNFQVSANTTLAYLDIQEVRVP